MTKEEALTLALEALENCAQMFDECKDYPVTHDLVVQAITDIHEALAQPEQEPVGFAVMERPWVGLTEEEQIQVAWSCGAMSADWLGFANSIEAKLKEKNNG